MIWALQNISHCAENAKSSTFRELSRSCRTSINSGILKLLLQTCWGKPSIADTHTEDRTWKRSPKQEKGKEKQKQNPTNIAMNGSYKQSYWELTFIPSEGFLGDKSGFCGFVCAWTFILSISLIQMTCPNIKKDYFIKYILFCRKRKFFYPFVLKTGFQIIIEFYKKH